MKFDSVYIQICFQLADWREFKFLVLYNHKWRLLKILLYLPVFACICLCLPVFVYICLYLQSRSSVIQHLIVQIVSLMAWELESNLFLFGPRKKFPQLGLGSALSLAHAHRTTRTRNYFLHIFSYFFTFPFSFTFPALPLFSLTTQNHPGKDHLLHPVSVSHFDLHFARKILVKLDSQIHVNCVPGSRSAPGSHVRFT